MQGDLNFMASHSRTDERAQDPWNATLVMMLLLNYEFILYASAGCSSTGALTLTLTVHALWFSVLTT
ncbi:hypothetical protein V8E53_010415 [Lactarius tabidus]